MPAYIKHDGEAALEWANQRRNAHWLWWRYERSGKTFVISCWQEEPWEQIGFLILRGVKHVKFAVHVSNVSFTKETITIEASDLANSRHPKDETLTGQKVAIIHIRGNGMNYNVHCVSFSLYELSNPSEGIF